MPNNLDNKLSNIKERALHIAELEGISKAAFCESIGVSYGAMKGSAKERPLNSKAVENILTVYPSINPEWLILGTPPIHKFQSNSIDDAERNKEAQVKDEYRVMRVPLVNQYAHAGYLAGFADETYIDELPKIPFVVDREYKGEYMCFEVKGDSMDNGSDDGYLEGDIILCRNIKKEYWTQKLHIKKWDFVVVHKEEGILVKRITNHNVERATITLHSLNPYYEDQVVSLVNVDRIFNIIELQRKRLRR